MVLAVDIGGTAIKIALTDDNGEIYQSNEYPSNAKFGGQALIKNLISIVKRYDKYERIGVSTAGQVDLKTGSIVYANDNIPNYTGMQLRKLLQHEFHIPIFIENDVNCAAIGEAHYGAAKGYKELLCLTYGTGIGCGIIINNDLYRGCSGLAGEIGHIVTHPKGSPCVCGQSGCYEQYASTAALVKKVMEKDISLSNGYKIFDAMRGGNHVVHKIIDDWIDEIIIGLVSLVHIFNPSCVVLGGGIMNETYILQRINQNIYSQIMPSFHDVVFKNAKIGNFAGLLGVGWLALNMDEEKYE